MLANGSSKSFPEGTNLFVVLQVGCLAERRLAPVALVGLLTGVNAPMVPEGGVPRESFVAYL